VDWTMGPCGGAAGSYRRQKASLLGIQLIALHFLTGRRHAKTSYCVWIAVNARKTNRQYLLYL